MPKIKEQLEVQSKAGPPPRSHVLRSSNGVAVGYSSIRSAGTPSPADEDVFEACGDARFHYPSLLATVQGIKELCEANTSNDPDYNNAEHLAEKVLAMISKWEGE